MHTGREAYDLGGPTQERPSVRAHAQIGPRLYPVSPGALPVQLLGGLGRVLLGGLGRALIPTSY